MAGETLRYAAVMTLAGIGIPVLAALNARLGGRIGSPAAAATVLFAVAFCGAAANPVAITNIPTTACFSDIIRSISLFISRFFRHSTFLLSGVKQLWLFC